MFRARLEAKAKIGGMVANSHVCFCGPVPTQSEYADAAIASLEERYGDDVTFKVHHVREALAEVAKATRRGTDQIQSFSQQNTAAEGSVRLKLKARTHITPCRMHLRMLRDQRLRAGRTRACVSLFLTATL